MVERGYPTLNNIPQVTMNNIPQVAITLNEEFLKGLLTGIALGIGFTALLFIAIKYLKE